MDNNKIPQGMVEELSKIGNVEVIKNDYVFTLFMTKNNFPLTSNGNPNNIMKIITEWMGEEKQKIELIKNEGDFMLIILKP